MSPPPRNSRSRPRSSRAWRRHRVLIAVAAALAAAGTALAVVLTSGGHEATTGPRTAPHQTAPSPEARIPKHDPRQSPPWGFTGFGWPTGGGWPDLCYRPVATSGAGQQQRVPDAQPCRPDSKRITGPTQIALAARAGADVGRLGAIWAAIEPLPPSEAAARGTPRFNWAPLVSRYRAMLADGIRPIVLAYGAPAWARRPGWDRPGTCGLPSGGCSYPPAQRRIPQWRAFVQGLMVHLPRMSALEVWNEPNYARFFAPHARPALYARLLRAADEAARDAEFHRPILTGGLSPIPPAGGKMAPAHFLSRVYDTAGKLAFDGIGAHPYPLGPQWTASMTANLDQLRRVSARFHDGSKPLWITEVGIGGARGGSGRFEVPLDRQGPVLAHMYRAARRMNVRSFLIYQLYDFSDRTSRFATYGVMTPSLRPKPGYCYVARHIGGMRGCSGTN